jgi:hypothetical protein
VQGATVYLQRSPSARDADLRRVGRVSGRGTLTFQVPHIRTGGYHLVARVRAGGTTRLIRASSSFRVVRG